MKVLFSEIRPEAITGNVFKMIGSEWALIAAGSKNSYNMMTVSWGTMGILWNREIYMCFIRPGRYTYEFIEKHIYFTANFFNPEYKEKLEYFGSNSGREVNKMNESGLTSRQTMKGSIYFEEAKLVLECKKIYYHDLDPGHFLDKSILENYELKDYHRLYTGEIINCLIKLQ
jgi:flavin reductase (DIM6/NTAB) family NADH-FMN oxidoreductase RutF